MATVAGNGQQGFGGDSGPAVDQEERDLEKSLQDDSGTAPAAPQPTPQPPAPK